MRAEKSPQQVSALIVDDEELARSLIKSLVRRDSELVLAGEAADGASALALIAEKRPDIVFLDVQMPGLNGLSVAAKLADLKPAPYIIFVTAFDEFAVKAFECNALDYLVKPIEKERFRVSVERAKSAIRDGEMLSLTQRLLQLRKGGGRQTERDNEPGNEIVVRKGDSIVQLATSDIVWIEAANQYVHIHTGERTYTASESLSQYARKIPDRNFYRIHRSALVNGAAVESISRQRNGTHLLQMRNGESLVVARSRRAIIPEILRTVRKTSARA